jgi:hypothetical protein
LLLKAIRTLPDEEQDVVIAYLFDRTVVSPAAPTRPPLPVFGEHGWSFPSAPMPQSAAWLILRRLAEGAIINQLASELRLDLDVLRTALDDVAKRGRISERLATILREIAEGSTIVQAASKLGLSEAQAQDELEPTESLSAALCASLTARAALHRPRTAPTWLTPQGPLRTMPVRFPEQQYQRLKDWSEQHNFPMAVVVRGVVERFLEEQQRSA